MLTTLRAMFRAGFRRLGWDIRRIPKLGDDPFADMARLLGGQERLTILDVGGNIGQSVSKFKQTFPDAAVHSFEPSTSTFATLEQNCRGMHGVKTWNCGIGSAAGKLPLFENTNSDMSSFLEQGKDSWGAIRQISMVDVMTLDAFAEREGIACIQVLKSDTQGFDLEVLKGAAGLLAANKVALIYCEVTFSDMYRNSPRFDQIYRFLEDNNFLLVTFYERYFQNGLMGWTDVLFINKEFHQKHRLP